jgi:uncharacterized protein (DUF58 family)
MTFRALTFLIVALLLYFFANQIQVGWIYVMAAIMAGVVPAAWWLGRGALKRIKAERKIEPTNPPHEGETVSVTLTFTNAQTDSHIRTTEQCPFAEPESPAKSLKVFIPSLSPRKPVQLKYETVVDRRGLHEFPPLKLETPAPFGLFRRKRLLLLPTRFLVYPEVRSLSRLSLFDRQPAVAHVYPRPGFGAEFIGVRPYRPGDSPRHIHWRSSARTNQLISKEFADDTQPGLTLVLDLFKHPAPSIDSKHTPFEWSVKIAASLGDYALKRGYALHLVADEATLAPPPGALSEIALLEYLARVQPTGIRPLIDVLTNRTTQTFVAVVLPYPDPAILESLSALHRRGIELLVVVLDPASFPHTSDSPSAPSLVGTLTANAIEARLIQYGTDWLAQFDPSPQAFVNPAPLAVPNP